MPFYGATDFFFDLPTETLGEGMVDVGMMLDFYSAEFWTKENKEELVVFLQARTFRSSNARTSLIGTLPSQCANAHPIVMNPATLQSLREVSGP